MFLVIQLTSKRRPLNCFRGLEILLKLVFFHLEDANENQDGLGFGRILRSIFCHEKRVRSFHETEIRHFDFRRINYILIPSEVRSGGSLGKHFPLNVFFTI